MRVKIRPKLKIRQDLFDIIMQPLVEHDLNEKAV